jgi:hypothetical protein
MSDRAYQYIQRHKEADSNRASWKSRWQSIGQHTYPLRGDINTELSAGSPRHILIYDDTVREASNICIAGLFSYMTPPYMDWKKLSPQNKELLDDEEVMWHINDREKRMDSMLSTSNFYNAMATLYGDLININHGLMFIDENEKERKLVFHNLSPADCVIYENNHHQVDSFSRTITKSARQAEQEWGDKIGKDVKQAIADNKPDKKFTFLHFVQPRKKYNPMKSDPENLPFESVYIDLKEQEIMDEGGYHEFPLVAPRWSVYINDVYGDCPGISSLDNVKTLNKAMELLIKQAEVQLNPPVKVTSGFKDRIKTMPGGLNVMTKKDDTIDPILTVGRIEISKELIQDLREQVRAAYYVNTFLMLSQLEQRMTAYEVGLRENEKMMMLGPAIGRITDECLDILIPRVYGLMERGGYFLPLPDGLQGETLDVEYVSQLARSQKAVQANSIDRLVGFMAPLTQLYPEIPDNFNYDEAYRVYADVFGVPPQVSRGKDSVAKMRATRQKMQEMEVQRQQMLQATEGIKQIAEADRAATGDTSILQQLMGQ